jgi:DHA2 family multidrug resistance protein
VRPLSEGSRRASLLIAAFTATFIDQGLSSAVSIALPAIAGSFAASGDETLWVNVAFSTAYYVAILLTPWVQSRFGYRRHYIASLVGVFGASLLCSASTDFGSLLLWRVVQGVALGGVFTNTLHAILINLEPRAARLALAAYGLFSLAGPALGPALGGVAVDTWSWRILFVGIALLALLSAALLQVSLRPTAGTPARFDLVGALLLATGALAYNVATQYGERRDWLADGSIVVAIVVCVLSLGAFAWWGIYGTRAPLIPLRLFRDCRLVVSLVLGIGLGVPLFAASIFLNFLQGSLHFTPTMSGTLLAVRLLAIVVCAPCFALLNSFAVVDTRILVAVGFVCTAASYGLQGLGTTTGSDFSTFVGSVLLSGIGFSAIFSPLVFSTISAIGMKYAAATSALLKMAFTLGGSLANAVLGIIIDHRDAQHWSDLAGSMTLSRSVVDVYLFAHPHRAVAELADLVGAQAQTMAFADAAYCTALATLLFLPLVIFLPISRKG